MKRSMMFLAGCLLAGFVQAEAVIKQVDLTGSVSADELVLKMEFEVKVEDAPVRMLVLEGDVVPTAISLPRGAEMVKEDGVYYIEFSSNGKKSVTIDFEAKVLENGQQRNAAFSVPSAAIRQITLQAEKEGYKVEVAGAPQAEKLDNQRVRAYLPSSGMIEINWSPELEKLSGDLVASCDSVLVGSAKVGALLLQGQYTYTIPQGRMKDVSMKLPAGLNIIQVTGADLLSWDVREQDGVRKLFVELSRPQEKTYALTIQAELPLAGFPCNFNFSVMEPQGVIRANGVVLVGTDSTIKLMVDELGGVTQVEPDAVNSGGLPRPKRGLYAYMFANMPFSMRLSADNIVTSLHAQDQLILALSETEATLDATVDLEVRDAPALDVELEISKDWTVTGAGGQNVLDYDVREREGFRRIKVYFKKEVDSRTLIQVRMEKTLPENASAFEMPLFRVADAKSERGFIVLRGETGTRLEGVELNDLREVNTGSLPIKIADARQAFRFKRPDWSGKVNVRQEMASIHVESFQLISLGESGVFGSSLITYNIANAPTRSFDLLIPAFYRNVEIHGRDMRNWTQNGDRWTVHLQQKVLGDYTLLVTYDYPAQYQGEALEVGGIQTLDVENETGYIALAGSANLSLAGEVGASPSILPIDVAEIPEEYALLVNDSIMHAYKYVAAPHEAQVRIKRFATQPLLTQVADHITLDTTISKDGEAVTLAVYHVKNTDQQYLPIRLPAGASLWSVNVDGNKIQVLNQGDGKLLVPVERRRDPNAPLKIEVTYAEKLNKPGLFSRMKFQSPQVDTQSVFARWTFKLPDGKRLLSAKGNMELPADLSSRRAGWGSLVSNMGFGPLLVWLCVCVTIGLGIFSVGKSTAAGDSFSLGRFMVGLCLLAAALLFAGFMLAAAVTLAGAYGSAPAEWAFSRAVSGSDGGLSIHLTLVNAGFEVVKTLVFLVAGLIAVVWMIATGKRKYLLAFSAALLALYSFVPYLACLTLLLPHLFVFYFCFMAGRCKGTVQRKLRDARNEMIFRNIAPAGGDGGFVRVRLAGLIAAVMVAVAGYAAVLPTQDAEPLTPPEETVESLKAEAVELQVTVPAFETESRVNVNVHMTLKLKAEKGDELQLLGPGLILANYDLSSRKLKVAANDDGSVLRVEGDGDYEISVDYLTVAKYEKGEWSAPLWIPDSLQNNVKVQLPVTGWNLDSAEAIRVRQTGTAAEILFSPLSSRCVLRWNPEERKTDLEQSRFFCDVNTLVEFRPGMVGFQHNVQFNIAQGELQNLQFDVPAGMSITEVRGKDIGTWRYDPVSGLLEVVLAAPATASYQMQIGAQIAQEKLPYQAVVKGLAVRNAVMQRGVMAFASSDAVQIDITSVEELSGINIGDAARLLGGDGQVDIKRAFRYNSLPFSATVSADQVLPELRLLEETSLDIATEQIRLSSRLNVTVSKSGIFALRIRIPEGFDVDSLSGDAVSHWDEMTGGTRELVVNFTRQITGTIPLNLVLSRSGRDLEKEFTVPRIQMEGVLKHTGTLGVTVERGIRVTPLVRDGVSEVSPRELGIRQEGCLAYHLLRPDWKVQLQADVMEPVIKAEVLQSVTLSEGLLKVRCYIQYDIEHAGVKTFRLQTPRPEMALVVSGRNISRVRKIDEGQGIWEVELHGKVESRYGMEAAYQLPFATDKSELVFQPLKTLGTDSQKGYIAVLSSGRLQIKPAVVSEFLRTEDARSIPRRFGAGDLSAAVLCYRTTESDFELKLNVVRHNAADVLPAQVKSVRLNSVITKDDQSLNSMTMTLDPGSLRFLEMKLPDGAKIWSVFVNETAVRPLVEEGDYLIPIEPGADLSASVEVMYAQAREKSFFGNKHSFSGPQFKLPLTDVLWTFYAPDGYRYSRFGGTMQYRDSGGGWGSRSGFDSESYDSSNAENSRHFGDSAKQNMVIGNEFMQSGDQRGARKAFQKAISYSQGQQALNEDARVQFRNLVRQQGVVGLVNRRNQLKQSLNQVDDETVAAPANEQWSETDVKKIEAQLGEKESTSLSALAEKMLDQQQAASVEVHPIRVVMAEQGVKIEFERTLQLQPETEMQVEFHSSQARGSRAAQTVFVFIAAGIIFISSRLIKKIRSAD